MYSKEEKQLNALKLIVENVPVPIELLDEEILSGYQRAKSEAKKQPFRKGWMFTLTAALILLSFFASIRLSPAFAGYISAIPGMEKIVELIDLDKGKIAAIENNDYQKIGATDEKNGAQMTIDGAIADDKGLVVFYTYHSKAKYEYIEVEKPDVKSLDERKLNVGTIGSSTPRPDNTHTTFKGTIEYYFQSPLEAKKLQINLSVKKDSFSIPIVLKKNVHAMKSYKINKTATIQGQKITFSDVEIYPLRVAVHVKMDPGNTKKLLDFKDLRLVDENGERWSGIANGVSGSIISDDEQIVYLQSNYFRKPKELYLALNKVMAVNKEERVIVVDAVKAQILKQPHENILNSVSVEGSDLVFKYHANSWISFNEITDGDGRKIESHNSYFMNSNEKGISQTGVNIPNLKQLKNPISLEIYSFPTWIEGEIKVKVN